MSKIYVDEILPKDNATVDGSKLSGLVSSAMPTGSVVQVVNTIKTDTWSGAATARSYSADVTGLSVSITPKFANSKLVVMASVHCAINQSPYRSGFGIFRDDAASGLMGDAAGSRIQTSSGRSNDLTSTYNTNNFNFTGQVDASSTTETTFSIRIWNAEATDGTAYVNRSPTDTDSVYVARGASSITVMEIAG